MIKIRRTLLIIIILLSIFVGSGAMYFFLQSSNYVPVNSEEYAFLKDLAYKYSKIEMMREYVEQHFYKEFATEKIDDYLCDAVFYATEDAYSYYMNESDFTQSEIDHMGVYSGVGITMGAGEEYITVMELNEQSPSWNSGIKVGDYIIRVDGKDFGPDELDDCADAVRGEEGTNVVITILSEGVEKDYTLTRKRIKTQSVSYSMKDDGIGYIKMSRFVDTTAEDFKSALKAIKQQGAKSFVLDIRDNPGGLVNICEEIADALMDVGTLVYTQDRFGNKEYYYTQAGRTDMDYVILVNGNSASCSEILVSGVQDNEEGIVVGTRTFGKGIIQATHAMSDGTAFQLTEWQYFSPNGNPIHGNGVMPDYYVELSDDCYDEDGNLINDKQLNTALDLLRKQ